LAGELSPYLRQHAHNPVDWKPWGEEAFAAAKREGKPIFLSIGYSACHWCHVMERESFESEETATLLNRSFICIKIDREERPDVDDLYMSFVQMTTGRGGWPMSVFLTPEKKPFFGGTYFRPDDFRKLITQVAQVWKDRRPEVEKSAEQITLAIQRQTRIASATARTPRTSIITDLLSELKSSFDAKNGGFSGAPKFPPHNTLPILLARGKDPALLRMAVKTLDAMACGGIRDHVGGGFHRYSTDKNWLVPHFEKMLYDNALLARSYAEAYKLTGRAEYAQVCRETLDWALRDMRGPEGGFYSALDADSEGQEGVYYIWQAEEIDRLLGADAPAFRKALNVRPEGNFRVEATGRDAGSNILHRSSPPGGTTERKWLDLLLKQRITRKPPATDEKRLTAWNALMIGSLARCGALLKEPRYVAEARKTADFVLSKLRSNGKLLRRWRPESDAAAAQVPGFLEDYAYLADAMLDLYDATQEAKWKDEAAVTVDKMIELFGDGRGGFFDSPIGFDELLVRSKTGYDGALPSPNGVAARALFRAAAATGRKEYRERALSTVKAFGELIERSPRGAQTLVAVYDLFVRPAGASEANEILRVRQGPVSVSARQVARGGNRSIFLSLDIAPGWHINSHRPLDPSLIPTIVKVGAGVKIGRQYYPNGKRVKLGFSQDSLDVYTGKVSIPISVISGRPGALVDVRVSFQACDDRACLAPQSAVLRIRLR
jgi:uncharacterized protein YyaL (SSP411 family)